MGQLTKADAARDRRLKDIYKMSLTEHDKKMEEQVYKCVICGRPFTKFQAYVDHDHKCCPRKLKKFCGKCNRGLLCFICNKYAVGLVEKFTKPGTEYPIDFVKVVAYLKKWDEEIKKRGGYEKKAEPKRKSSKQKSV